MLLLYRVAFRALASMYQEPKELQDHYDQILAKTVRDRAEGSYQSLKSAKPWRLLSGGGPGGI